MPTATAFLARAARLLRRAACGGAWALLACASPGQAQPAAAAQPLLMVEQGAHSAPVRRIDVARGWVVTASDDRTARVWDQASGELRHVLRPLAFGDEGGRLYGVAIHPSRPLVAVGGTTGGEGRPHAIYLFDLESGALLRTIDARAGHVRNLAWSADGSVLLATFAGEHGLRAYSLDGAPLLEVRGAGPVFGLAVSPHGLAATAGLDGSVQTFRVGAGAIAPLQRFSMGARRAAGVSFSPDGQRLAIAYADVRIGANGRESRHEPVEIIDAASGRSLARLDEVPVFGGDLRVVAWSRDGHSIYAGGTAYTRAYEFPVVQFDAASGRSLAVTPAASDSITDLVALPDGTLAFSSFDGSWGLLRDARVVRRTAPGVATVRGGMSDDFELSDDARSVRWGVRSTGTGRGFQFERRQVGVQMATPLRAPETRFSLFNRPSDWNLSRGTPIVGGKPLPLAQDERSRALAVVRATATALIGTNRAVYQLDEHGNVLWRRAVDTEVRALNASSDGRWVVGALADGTVRWWRGRDGVHVLTLLVQSDGRWVVWTPGGYFDASAGADRLVGWALANAASSMDFYSLNRFRERFNRPDVIDALLQTQDEAAALAQLQARDAALREAALREAAALQEQAAALARAAQQAERARREADERDAQARLAAQRAAQEAQALAEAARAAEARRQAAQAAQREAAVREAAQRQAEAQLAAEREAAQRRAAQEAERVAAALAAQQQAARREAAEREAAAALAAAEAAAREAAINERKALAIVKALEVPPSLSASQAKRIELAAPEVTLRFAIASSGDPAKLLLEVRINGRPAQPSELMLPQRLDGVSRGFAKLPLGEGESLVEILAHNAYGVSEPLAFTIERTHSAAGGAVVAAPPPSADLYVLAIGISDYVRADYRLGLAAKDARDFADTLRRQQGKQYRSVHVRVLADRDATRSAIVDGFEWLRQSVGPSDVAMLFMAGHGLNDALGQYFFLPADGRLERLATTALPQGTIVSTLSKVRGRTLLFLDTCFAGSSMGALSKVGRQTEKMMNDLASSENGVIVFASSTGQEESEEKLDWGNGAFTKVLIEGLSGKADFTGRGRVTFAALNLFLSEGVSRLTEGRQRPVFISPRGVPDFALVSL